MTKPRPDQPGRCPSIDPHDTLQCTRSIHDDDQCQAGGIAWRKGSPRIEWDRERADRLQEEVEEYDAILRRQGDLLTRTVNALRGNPPPLTSWSHHDIPELAAEKVAEVERLTAERDALAQIKRHIDEVRDGTGWTVQIYGVLLQQCDQYGKTIDTRRAEQAESERDALAAQVARVEALGAEWLAMDEANADYFSRERLEPTLVARVATIRQERLQAALAAPTETDDLERCDCGRVVPCRHCDPTGQEDSPDAGHRCEPYYSRAECGQCGWQEQWCVTCSRQMCGCATDAMGADQ